MPDTCLILLKLSPFAHTLEMEMFDHTCTVFEKRAFGV